MSIVGTTGSGQTGYPPTQNGKEKRPGLITMADYLRVFPKIDTLQVPVSRLAYSPGADLMNGAAVAATTWTDLHANQNFTVGSATAWIVVEIKLGLVASAAALAQIAARAFFNSGGTPLAVMYSAGMVSPAGGFDALNGSTFFIPPAILPTGTNTIKTQIYGAAALTVYCRPVGAPNTDFYGLRITEISA